MTVLVADHRTIRRIEPGPGAPSAGAAGEGGTSSMAGAGGAEARDSHATGLSARPTSVLWDPHSADRAWAGTRSDGVYRSDDGGRSWAPAGLRGRRVMTVVASPTVEGLLWAGTEPSAVWRSDDNGESWRKLPRLDALPSSGDWSFPPRPETHHVRWIAPHPLDRDRLWVAIEAGALVRTSDGGSSWQDRVAGGPYDTHELAIHPDRPDTLRVAAGDGYYESQDGGETWNQPRDGLDAGYLRSVAIDPGDPATVVVSAATHAHAAYTAGRSDGRLFRRVGDGPWHRVTEGWPDPPDTIAPLLVSGTAPGELWAADERGVHRSADGGVRWRRIVAFRDTPDHLRGLAVR